MAEVFDINLDANFDIGIDNGDFVIKESTRQHQQCLLIAEPGDYKQNPGMGVGAYSFTNDDETIENLKKAIQKTFEEDGMSISRLKISTQGDIDVTANYL